MMRVIIQAKTFEASPLSNHYQIRLFTSTLPLLFAIYIIMYCEIDSFERAIVLARYL